MPRRGRRTGSGATTLQESAETVSSDAIKMMPETSTVSESVRTAATVSPTESEIATVAYQLWLDNGCPIGSDQEDWFRAEAMLKNALVAKCEDPSRPPSIPPRETRPATQVQVRRGSWRGRGEHSLAGAAFHN